MKVWWRMLVPQRVQRKRPKRQNNSCLLKNGTGGGGIIRKAWGDLSDMEESSYKSLDWIRLSYASLRYVFTDSLLLFVSLSLELFYPSLLLSPLYEHNKTQKPISQHHTILLDPSIRCSHRFTQHFSQRQFLANL